MSQFFHVHPDNPQARLIKQAADIIKQGGVVVYPTDSGYAIGCGIGNKQAKERIERIRGIEKHHNFTLMCRDLSELATYARVDNQMFRLIKNNTPGPYTFIFKGTKEVPKRLLNDKKKTIGIRVTDHPITSALLTELGEPLMSCSLILPGEQFTESDPDEIRLRIEKLVDLIIHGGYLIEQATTVIDLSEDEVDILRVGCGDTAAFT
ncbi:L-threonylcarbamoyladenylate synthase [Pseudoalteromonas aurantia]|uniref:Threonylcarbamoyl-AMP synthase n=1 Tax=Pseudoalteromonas aurantia TaxID=43654 RepID=A0A5S3V959_9GAMM|nr:L-threonylcarbamoyladenylate synthase [Pseudoalteromonas aurantia]TMO65425.1 threonylcarbamoyl-AMP synthase [Pseudoalteromonas aurantia]TMO67906.1 threonylcarbamoyl-AMP synthase [Pseudoalteromonas aurantia]TMO71723.1 threonylcarbamoyl-AMP synthase [Pseudoalteromonas aurantia]